MFFCFDSLALVMSILIIALGSVVGSFAWRFLRGDRRRGRFFLFLVLMVAALLVLVSADHLWLFLASWGLTNLFLVFLMVHKGEWGAARVSGRIAAQNFLLGFGSIGGAFALLSSCAHSTSIQVIVQTSFPMPWGGIALVLLSLGAMTQCALWPFHRWLLSSLNSPTPVSALMHAGLINGGGFLLVRFAPLFLQQTAVMTLLFGVGLISALCGTYWKMVQSDVKRMLACSTMGQMGFMVMQCALGLFPAAVAHLCWHGLFKASLFLSSSSAAKERRIALATPTKLGALLVALVGAAIALFVFTKVMHFPLFVHDTRLVIYLVLAICAAQFLIPLLNRTLLWTPVALLLGGGIGGLYGANLYLIESILPHSWMQPLPLNLYHYLGCALLSVLWLALPFLPKWRGWNERLYVQALNASQPHRDAITAHRNHYRG